MSNHKVQRQTATRYLVERESLDLGSKVLMGIPASARPASSIHAKHHEETPRPLGTEHAKKLPSQRQQRRTSSGSPHHTTPSPTHQWNASCGACRGYAVHRIACRISRIACRISSSAAALSNDTIHRIASWVCLPRLSHHWNASWCLQRLRCPTGG